MTKRNLGQLCRERVLHLKAVPEWQPAAWATVTCFPTGFFSLCCQGSWILETDSKAGVTQGGAEATQ